jgi:predicted Zn-dependent peptidase
LHYKTVLENGVRVVTENIPHVRSVATGIWLNVGSRDERDGDRGLTHFIEHMLFKGTRRRTALDIAKELDAVGGFANAFTSKENLCVHTKVLHKQLPLVMDLLTDIFLSSTFDPEEIEREREVILQEIGMIEDTPDEYVHILFQELYWKDNPLGLPIYGTEDAVEEFDRDRILRYIERTFDPRRIVVAAAGCVDNDAFLELAGPVFGRLTNGAARVERTVPRIHQFREVIPKDLEQVHICMAMPGCSQTDKTRSICHLTNVILGSSMSSRLFQEVREKRGLAYSVYSFLNSHEDVGMLGVYAGVGPESVGEALKVIHDELRRFAAEPVSEAELHAAKEHLKGGMHLNAESTDSRMNRLAKNELLFGRMITFEEVENWIDEVTPEAIQQWFRASLPDEGLLPTMVFGPVRPDVLDNL